MSTTTLLLAVSPLAMNVSKAQEKADNLKPIYDSAKKAYELAREALNVENRKVFEARSLYLVDLLKQVVTDKKNPDLLVGCLTGKMPFTINMQPERLSFGLTVHATDTAEAKEIHTFENVEQFLLNYL